MVKAFECKMCGECCYGEGGIFISDQEISEIAKFLDISRADFIRIYCEKRLGQTGIKTGKDGFCIFFDSEKQCLIHPAKPQRCRKWPFFSAIVKSKDNWDLAKDACPGINPECSFEEFVRQASKQSHQQKHIDTSVKNPGHCTGYTNTQNNT